MNDEWRSLKERVVNAMNNGSVYFWPDRFLLCWPSFDWDWDVTRHKILFFPTSFFSFPLFPSPPTRQIYFCADNLRSMQNHSPISLFLSVMPSFLSQASNHNTTKTLEWLNYILQIGLCQHREVETKESFFNIW